MNSVTFKTEDEEIQNLYDAAEERLKSDLRCFGGKTVLTDGSGHEKLYQETQPMSGEMYAKRNLRVGLNNQILFMEHIRKDGKLPTSIGIVGKKPEAEYEGSVDCFSFPQSALELYYLMGEDKDYLLQLAMTLERYDYWMWHSNETESVRNFKENEDEAKVFLSRSFSSRKAMAEIASLLRNSALEQKWRLEAQKVRERISGCSKLENYYLGAAEEENAKAFFENFKGTTGSAKDFQKVLYSLEHYNLDGMIPKFGKKLFGYVGNNHLFVEQYDPVSGTPKLGNFPGGKPSYAPSALACLEYIAAMYGVRRKKDRIFWGCTQNISGEYTQVYGDNEYRIRHMNGLTEGFLNGKWLFRTAENAKLVTDVSGTTLSVIEWK